MARISCHINGRRARVNLPDRSVTAMIELFTAALGGAVPASGGGTTKFLRADSVWAVPGAGPGGIPSNPPTGQFTVTNLYVDAATGMLVVEYDDTPEP